MIKRLVLTDTEWMRLIDGDREDTALPRCCANVSALRDTIIQAARAGGAITFMNGLETALGWCYPEHGTPDPVLQKVADQLEVKLDVVTDKPHDPQSVEL